MNAAGTVRLGRFYGARARRLLPASAFVAVVIMIGTAVLEEPDVADVQRARHAVVEERDGPAAAATGQPGVAATARVGAAGTLGGGQRTGQEHHTLEYTSQLAPVIGALADRALVSADR